MDKETIKKTLEELKKTQKRNFTQTIDLIIILRNFDLKKDGFEFYHRLHYKPGKDIKICAFVGAENLKKAKDVFDTAISVDDFPKYQKDKKLVRNMANNHDFFVAQANIMPKVATAFGKVLGPRGKMPNPKAGAVFPPNADLKAIAAKLSKTIKINAKNTPMIQLAVGKEDSEEKEIIDNILTTYNDLLRHLPSGRNNIKKVLLKYTMSKPFKLE